MQGRSLLAQRSLQEELHIYFELVVFWPRVRAPQCLGYINRPKGALRAPIAASLILIHSSKTNYFQKQNVLLRPQTRVVRGVYLIMSLKFWTIELSNLANLQRRIFVIFFVYHRERRVKTRKETARYFWMGSSRVVRASDCQCRSRNSPGFDLRILRHNGIWGAAD
jgi:hypothetical protein